MVDNTDEKKVEDAGVNLFVPKWLLKIAHPLAFAVVLTLLAIHTFEWHRADVDYVSVALVGLLVIIPIAQYVKRIKVGRVEAEIDTREVRNIEAEAAGVLPRASIRKLQRDVESLDILSLSESEPPLGLAKLRIELEKEIQKRYEVAALGRGRRTSMTQMIRELEEINSISSETGNLLRKVLSVANRAIHGEYVRSADAVGIAEVGVGILEGLKAERVL